MKRFFPLLVALFLVFGDGCTTATSQDAPEDALFCDNLADRVQELEQLHVASETTPAPTSTYVPSNDTPTYAMWFPVMNYAEILAEKTEEQFRNAIAAQFQDAKALGINTVYLHVRAFGDAYYPSDLFPPGSNWTDQSFDPLEIMLEEAHALGLSAHGWINPLRCGTKTTMDAIADSYQLKQWYLEGTYLKEVNGYYWLCPAYPEVREFIANGVQELVQQYDLDGIHLDDYFYPTTGESFDSECFSASGETDLSQFRLEQINEMVQSLYQTVKATNDALQFSISPQGTISGNYQNQYADVTKWASTEGFCDVLIPQVYFGFQNETAPFAETVSLWEEMVTCSDVSLVIGIGTHKFGKEDTWAGSGSTEWQENLNLPLQQVQYLLKEEAVQGIAFYSYTTTFQPDTALQEMAEQVAAIGELLRPLSAIM